MGLRYNNNNYYSLLSYVIKEIEASLQMYTHAPTHLVVAVGVTEVIDDLRAAARLLPSPLMFETCWCSGAFAFTAGS